MLNDLYRYAIKNDLAFKPGFSQKNVKAYIVVSNDAEFISIEPVLKGKIMCPDIGAAALGTKKSNILVEKAEIVLLMDEGRRVKHEFFKAALKEGAEYEPLFEICLKFLENNDQLTKAREKLLQEKYKPSDIVGFKVETSPVEQSENYLEWWEEFRNRDKTDDGAEKICFITGQASKPVDTVKKVSGLSVVGGHTAGDTLICFDKAAFESYNLKQAHNASVSEEATTAVNAALEKLIHMAPIHAGTKFVHWYKEKVKDEYDYLKSLDFNFNIEDEIDSEQSDEKEQPSEKEQPQNLNEIRSLINCIYKGENPYKVGNRYYILSLSGAGGRIMVRNYMQGSCDDLFKSFCDWFNDLKLVSRNGKSLLNPPKLFSIYIRLLKKEKSRKYSDRMAKELSGLDMQVKYSIINNTQLPDPVASRILLYIRSDLLESDEITLDATSCQVLKAWLIRKQKLNKEEITVHEELNQKSPSQAYHAGRMMAVFAAIQREALGKVGASVIQRYYSSASISPALVLGKLSNLSQYHLDKIENKAFAFRYQKMLEEISLNLSCELPATLSLEEQSQFAIGYYQQNAHMYQSNEANNKNKDKNMEVNDDDSRN